MAAYFPTDQPLEVDLGCGKGRFLLTRAERHPEINLLGIDRMLRRIRKIDRQVQLRQLSNVRVMRIEAYYAVSYLIPPESVSTYYLFFPDPWPKRRHFAQRLFSPQFLDAVARTLAPQGALHITTDNDVYFDHIAKLFCIDDRFAQCDPFVPAVEERTDFERYFIETSPIYRLSVVTT